MSQHTSHDVRQVHQLLFECLKENSQNLQTDLENILFECLKEQNHNLGTELENIKEENKRLHLQNEQLYQQEWQREQRLFYSTLIKSIAFVIITFLLSRTHLRPLSTAQQLKTFLLSLFFIFFLLLHMSCVHYVMCSLIFLSK